MPTDRLLTGHRRFRERFERDRELFRRLAEEGQEPKVLWFGCSDSRVVPEQITGAEPGELFLARNIANVVPPASEPRDAVGAVIEYAVLHLRVRHAVVCGHGDCGGIRALEGSLEPEREPHLARWLELARPARERAVATGASGEALYEETIRANVLLQCENLRSYPCVREAEEAGRLSIHPWLYNLLSGQLLAWGGEGGGWEPVAPGGPPGG